MKATRREVLAALAGSTAAVAQTAPESQPDELTVQREQARKNAQALASVDMPVTLEPAFVFKA